MNFFSTKTMELGSAAFRQWRSVHSHCQFIHGYRLTAKFVFGAQDLDARNWVVDFGGLKPLKATLQNFFDHKLVIAADDPKKEVFLNLEKENVAEVVILEGGVGVERFAELCYNLATDFIANTEQYKNRCWVESVEVFEHADNSAICFGSSI